MGGGTEVGGVDVVVVIIRFQNTAFESKDGLQSNEEEKKYEEKIRRNEDY